MKKTLGLRITVAFVLAITPLVSMADTTFFSDNFTGSSTLTNATPGAPTSTSTSYELISTKAWNPPPSIAPGHLMFGITNSTAGTIEVQGLFASPAVALVSAGDYIRLSVTFTDTQGLLIQTSPLGFGMYNAGGVAPIGSGLNGNADSGTTTAVTGGAQNWKGYVAIINFTNGNSGFYIRTNQTGTGNNNQDLVTSGSSTKSYNNPKAAVIGVATNTPSVVLTVGSQYTEILTYTLTSTNTLQLDSRLYTGPDNTGTLLSTMTATTGTNLLSTVFDGLAFGWYANQSPAVTNTLVDVNSITVSGTVTLISGPPHIDSQPVPVSVATNGSCPFSVSATGVGVTYQWCRNGTNLLDGGNISGSTSSRLAISSAGPADALSGANGYYVIVTGTGPYSTNSVTNSLTLMPATNLTWTAAGGNTWDLNTTVSWQDTNGNPTVFNYGDPVTLDDSASSRIITLAGSYLSAASVTVDATGVPYRLTGSGSLAGSGSLILKGGGMLKINTANTYTGGTIISNAGALLYLENYSGLGNGPVTFAKAGGSMEIVPAGGASSGINGDIVVADDFTIQFDGLGAYSGVLYGNLSGTAGKTLTLTEDTVNNTTTNNRVRVYGTNTTYDAKLVLGSLITLAPYNSLGSQTYNGVISGGGAIMEKGTTTYLNGANTYSGGTFPVSGAIGLGIDSVGSPVVTSGPIGTSPLFLTVDSTTTLTANGMILASGGARTIANLIQYPTGTNNLTLIIGGTNNLTLSGAFTLNGNDLITTNTFTARTVQVTNTGLTTLSGVISDLTNGVSAAYGFTKTGSGVLALNNTETYTGPTAVSNGTLQVNGSLNAASAVTVRSNATLAGTGVINGTVTNNAGSTLAPGTASAIGTLAINNNLTLNGNLFFKVNKSLSPSQSNDVASVSGTLASGGTGFLTVSNLGPALAVGDKFYLFNKALTGGGTLGVTGGGVTWNNNLAVDGSISVGSLTSLKPLITSTILSGVTSAGNGTNLIFSGTNGIAGAPYYVLYQTNLATPLSNWIRLSTNTFLPGGTFSVTNTISPSVPQRFYLFYMPY
jgi:autotransporter-associated beta strand protein